MHTRYTYHIRGVAENAWADQWYIGSRTATHGRTPEEDIGIHYFTSSSNNDFVAQFKTHPEWFVCTILERGYPDDRTMEDDEKRRITESWNVVGRINRTDGVILFERDEAYKANHAVAVRKRSQNPVYQETRRKMNARPEYKANQAAGARKANARPEYQETMRKVRATPEWKANNAVVGRKNAQNPVWRAENAAGNRKRSQDPVWKAKNAVVGRKNAQNPEFGKKVSAGKKRARALRDAAKTNTDT